MRASVPVCLSVCLLVYVSVLVGPVYVYKRMVVVFNFYEDRLRHIAEIKYK